MRRMLRLTVVVAWLAAMSQACGSHLLFQPDFDGKYLALEISGELAPPDELAARLSSDLASIRMKYPEMAAIHAFPHWLPGDVLLEFDQATYDAAKAGDYSLFAGLFQQLGQPEVSLSPDHPPSPPSGVFSFGVYYHGERLAELFALVPGVTRTFANDTVGDGDDIDVLPGGVYLLSRGYGDCPAGCTDRHTWRFQVTDDDVIQLSASPEPGTATLAITALACLARGVRRSNSSRRLSIHHEALHRSHRPGRRP